MRKPVVDYRQLRFSNIHQPQYSHLFLLLGWVGYFLLYVLTENLIPIEKCTPVSCWLDYVIPFCEWFLIPYTSWYLLIVVTLLYFLLYNVENFRRVQTYIIITQVVAMVIYIVFPNRQDLRPEFFERDNLLTRLMGFIYAFDTNTGVCPSLHVAYSLGIASAWLREKSAAPFVRGFIAFWCVLICISVAFVKQHSVVDIFAALPLCAFCEWFVFFRPKHKKVKAA